MPNSKKRPPPQTPAQTTYFQRPQKKLKPFYCLASRWLALTGATRAYYGYSVCGYVTVVLVCCIQRGQNHTDI